MIGSVACQLPSEVVCAAFGTRRSHEVVACGDAEGSVHVLPFGNGSRFAKLTGHTSRVTAIAFDAEQRRIVAGSDGGSIRLWDIDTETCVRTFGNGHKTTVTSVDYHCFGEFVATVSEDARLRIWDVRKKSCMQSYKDSPNGLRVVRFNPNGKWVVSGCNSGIVRLYDLSMGTIVKEMPSHSGAVTSLKFHPEHLFLTTGGADGSMTLWEMDSISRTFRSEPIGPSKPVSQVCFHTDGDNSAVLVASDHLLRSFPFSRMSNRTAACTDAPWTTVSDMVCSPAAGEVLAVECSGSTVQFSRLALTSSRSTAVKGVMTPSAQAAQKPQINLSPPPSASPNGASPISPPRDVPSTLQPVVAMQSPRTGAPQQPAAQVFKMNDKQAQYLIQRAQTPPNDRRASIPMIPMDDNPGQRPGTVGSGISGTPTQSLPPNFSDQMATTEQLLGASPPVLSMLQRRLTHLRVVRSTWPTDPRSALRHLLSIAKSDSDVGAVTDFLTAMQNQRMKERVTFDLLGDFLQVVLAALQHKQDPILVAALRISRSMNTKFRSKIDETLRGAQFAANGVDLAMEARVEKCRELQGQFEAVLTAAAPHTIRKDPVGDEARSVMAEIPSLARRR